MTRKLNNYLMLVPTCATDPPLLLCRLAILRCNYVNTRAACICHLHLPRSQTSREHQQVCVRGKVKKGEKCRKVLSESWAGGKKKVKCAGKWGRGGCGASLFHRDGRLLFEVSTVRRRSAADGKCVSHGWERLRTRTPKHTNKAPCCHC